MIYLNNAATSWPKAPGVAEAVSNSLIHLPGDENRASAEISSGASDCRGLLASLLGVSDPRRLVLTSNATQALNIAMLGFPWKRGDRVLTTQAEHNSVLRPLYHLKKQGIIDYIVLPVEADGSVDPIKWKEALGEIKPRLVVFTHASNASGAVNNAAMLSALAKDAGAFVLIDASQTLGLIPVAPAKWGADMLAFTGHKYLLGPQGTGGLYISSELELAPVFTGGTGIHSDQDEMPLALPMRLEAGTGNSHSFAGLSAAIKYTENNPVDLSALFARLTRLEAGLSLAGMKPIKVQGTRTPVVAAVSPLYSADVLGEILSGFDIICRTGLHCAPFYPNISGGTIRFSLSRFTTDEEINQTIDALREVHSE